MTGTEKRDPAGGPDPVADDAHGGGKVTSSLQRRTDGQRDWRELWRPALHLATMRCTERRARVLKHPDLAELLTLEPLSYARPDQWTGYVPPRLWDDKLNTDPRRQALVAICAEAMNREKPRALDVT